MGLLWSFLEFGFDGREMKTPYHSANFDMRSLFLNYEIALFFTRSEDVLALRQWFQSLVPECGDLMPSGRGRVLVEAVARLLGPLA